MTNRCITDLSSVFVPIRHSSFVIRHWECAMAEKIVSGDDVMVVSGKNKGQRGRVRTNMPKKDRIIIEGVNIVRRHLKQGRARQAGIVEMEAPLHVSNVMLYCGSCNSP